MIFPVNATGCRHRCSVKSTLPSVVGLLLDQIPSRVLSSAGVRPNNIRCLTDEMWKLEQKIYISLCCYVEIKYLGVCDNCSIEKQYDFVKHFSRNSAARLNTNSPAKPRFF